MKKVKINNVELLSSCKKTVTVKHRCTLFCITRVIRLPKSNLAFDKKEGCMTLPKRQAQKNLLLWKELRIEMIKKCPRLGILPLVIPFYNMLQRVTEQKTVLSGVLGQLRKEEKRLKNKKANPIINKPIS